MKIYSVGYTPNRAKIENRQEQNRAKMTHSISPESSTAKIPYHSMLANSAITFSGASLKSLMPKTTTGVDLAELLNCALCDRPMILSEELFDIKWPSPAEPIKSYNKKLIAILKPYKSKMHEGELAVFDTLNYLNSQYPDKTFQELLSMVREANLEKLHAKENKILNNLKFVTNDLPQDVSKNMRALIADSQSRIALDEENHPFKRKIFIERLKDVLGVPTKEEKWQASVLELAKIDKEKAIEILGEEKLQASLNIGETQLMKDKKKILALVGEKKALSLVNKAYLLPSSKDNRSAFIVKYASKVKKYDGTWAYRTSQEISHNLLCSSRSTLDHIVEQNPESILAPKGETIASNLAFLCDGCNSFFKENTELAVVAKRYPKIPKNLQKQVDSLIYYTNKGIIIDGDPYIRGYAATLEKSSTKDVDLRVDISRLDDKRTNPPSPSFNRNSIRA